MAKIQNFLQYSRYDATSSNNQFENKPVVKLDVPAYTLVLYCVFYINIYVDGMVLVGARNLSVHGNILETNTRFGKDSF